MKDSYVAGFESQAYINCFFVIELTQIPNCPLNLTLYSEIEQKFKNKRNLAGVRQKLVLNVILCFSYHP